MDMILKWPSVRCAKPEEVLRKINALREGGFEKLMVISDFDYTISRSVDADGSKCWTTHAVFDYESSLVNPELGGKLHALRDQFMPIEFDPDMSIEEKIPHMLKWWTTAHNYISRAGFDKATLERFTRDSRLRFREKSTDLLAILDEKHVPLVLFSAGVGDLIQIFLRQQIGHIQSNIHLISNMIQYDANERVVGFKEPLIHTFNKNKSVIDSEREFFHKLVGRSNVLLLGDSLGDIHMDVGVEKESNVLKIGFLNFNMYLFESHVGLGMYNLVDKLLPQYLVSYDLVLVEDQTMHVPMTLIDSFQN